MMIIKSLKRRYIVCLVVLLALLLFGCAEDEEERGVKPTISAEGSVTEGVSTPTVTQEVTQGAEEPVVFTEKILYWAVTDGFALKDDQLRQFNKMLIEDGCDFNVQIVHFRSSEYESQIKAYSDTPIDIASTGVDFADGRTDSYRLIQSGFFEPLEKYLENSPVQELFADVLWESVAVEDRVYSIPSFVRTDVIGQFVYNMKYFTEEEVENMPLTLEGIEPYLERLDKKEGFSPLLYEDESCLYLTTQGHRPYFGMMLDEEAQQLLLAGESSIYKKHLDTLHRFVENGYIDYQVRGYDTASKWMTGVEDYIESICNEVSLEDVLSSGAFGIYIDDNVLKENAFDYDVMIRNVPGTLNTSTAAQWGIAANSQHKDEAWKLLELFYTKPEYQKLVVMKDANFVIEDTKKEDLLAEYFPFFMNVGTDCELQGEWSERNAYYEQNYSVTDTSTLHLQSGEYGAAANRLSVLWDEGKYIWLSEDYEALFVQWKSEQERSENREWVAEANAQLQEHLEKSKE